MKGMRTFFVQNFGCRATQADGAALEALLAEKGLLAAGRREQADLVVLNTCTVTSAADEDVRRTVRRVHRENDAARILVTGCYAQRAPTELAVLPGVAWVVGNSHKSEIAELVSSAEYHGQVHVGDIFAPHEFLSAPIGDAGHTRPNLKIQDGCDNRCSFCIIPSVRGRSRSSPLAAVVEQVREMSHRHREVVLSGINLGRWGRERGAGSLRLTGLLRAILSETDIARVRLSSVEPMDFSDELLELMASSSRIARHVHAPLQSGSDAVLRRMKRKYRVRHYADRILKAREGMPDAAIGADVMVGFPGETAEEFEQSREFIASLPFTYLHVFTYSERAGTPAAAAPDPVPMQVRRQRNAILRQLGEDKNLAFRRSMVGKRLSVVTLNPPGAAISSNYPRVELARLEAANQMMEVEIGSVTESGLLEAATAPAALRVLSTS